MASSALSKFSRRIKLTYFFAFKQPKKPKLFTDNSTWTPPLQYIPEDIIEELESLDTTLANHSTQNHPDRKSLQHISILQTLRKDPDIIIKPADKGSSLVIMNTQDYISEANRQLNNPLHYTKIHTLLSPTIRHRYISILRTLLNKKILTKKQVDYLSPPDNPRPRKFY